MNKNAALFGTAIAFFILSCVFFVKAYRQVSVHTSMTERSIEVYNTFQLLSMQITNAAIHRPLADTRAASMDLFFPVRADSVLAQLRRLNALVRDSVNQRVAEQLQPLVLQELPWLMASNVPDSLTSRQAQHHIVLLLKIDSLIGKGIERTRFLFQHRRHELMDSLQTIQWQASFFLLTSALLCIYLLVKLHLHNRASLKYEQHLENQEKRFRDLVEDGADLIALADAQFVPFYRSPSALKITGYTDRDMVGRSILEVIHPDDREVVRKVLADIKAEPGKRAQVRYRLLHQQGHYIWLEGSLTNQLQNPALRAIVINTRDVTQAERYTQQLRDSEERYRRTLDGMMEGAQMIGFDWRYIYVNDALLTYSTYTREQMLGQTVMELYPGVEETPLFERLKQCMFTREPQQLENEFRFPNGEVRFFDLNVQPVPEGIFILSIDISQRRSAELDLQKRVKELRDYKYALDEAAIVAITDQRGIIRHVNDNFCKVSKFSRAELVDNDHRIVNSSYHSKEFFRQMWRTIASGNIWKGEIRNRTKTGEIYWVDTAIIPFLTAEGKPYQYLAIRYDITDRKQGEEEVIKLSRLYAFISAINQSIVHIQDKNILLNKACEIAVHIGGFQMAWIESMEGSKRSKIISISGDVEGISAVARNQHVDYSQPGYKNTPIGVAVRTGQLAFNNRMQDDPALAELRDDFVKRNIASAICLPIRAAGDSIALFSLTSSQSDLFDSREIALLEEAAGDIGFALENFEKAALHLRTQELVIANERRYRALLEKSTDMKTLTNEHGQFTYVSPSVLSTFGYDEQEVIGRFSFEFFHPDDRLILIEKRNSILDTAGAYMQFQYRIRHKAGHWVWCEGTLTNLLDDPDVHALVSNFRDISERKLLEEEKDFDARNLAALINNTNDLLWSIDRSYRLITFNRTFYEMVKQLLGKEVRAGDNVMEVSVSAQQQVRLEGYYDRAFSGEIFSVVESLEEPFEYVSEISFYPIRQGEQIIGTACHSRDITQRRRAEREREAMVADLVRHTKNLEQFTFIVSHNLRAPVAHILGLANVLKNKLSPADRERSQAYLFGAVEQLDTVINDLNSILEAGATAGRDHERVDLQEILEEVKRGMAAALHAEQAVITTAFETPYLFGFKSYIYSIFVNLIGNAIKYRRPNDTPLIHISSVLIDQCVELRFSDNGLGMDLDQYRDKVFGMYQRFHLHSSGKGLGLFMVKTQVEAMAGEILVNSKPGEGTQFLIRLPQSTYL